MEFFKHYEVCWACLIVNESNHDKLWIISFKLFSWLSSVNVGGGEEEEGCLQFLENKIAHSEDNAEDTGNGIYSFFK